MSCLSSAIANRKAALLCARLIVQCLIGSFDSQMGVDGAVCLGGPVAPRVMSVAGLGRDMPAPKHINTRETRPTLPPPRPV
jgi:hypothetical protein